MIQGLIWMFSSVACALALIHYIPKSIGSAVLQYRKRNVEASTESMPSAVCPVDGGKWGPWSKLQEESRANNPRYPNLDGHHVIRTQTRQCAECGFAERRVL